MLTAPRHSPRHRARRPLVCRSRGRARARVASARTGGRRGNPSRRGLRQRGNDACGAPRGGLTAVDRRGMLAAGRGAGEAESAVALRRQRRTAGRGASRRKTNPKPLPLRCWQHAGFEVGWRDALVYSAVRGLTFWGIQIRFSPLRWLLGRFSCVFSLREKTLSGFGGCESSPTCWGSWRRSSRCTRNRLRQPPRSG